MCRISCSIMSMKPVPRNLPAISLNAASCGVAIPFQSGVLSQYSLWTHFRNIKTSNPSHKIGPEPVFTISWSFRLPDLKRGKSFNEEFELQFRLVRLTVRRWGWYYGPVMTQMIHPYCPWPMKLFSLMLLRVWSCSHLCVIKPCLRFSSSISEVYY